MNDIEFAELARKRVQLKDAEEQAIKARRECDAQIQDAIGRIEEGTLKHDTGGVKVSVAYSLTRSISDPEELRGAWNSFPADVRACFRWKPEVDTKRLKELATSSPSNYGYVCAQFITTKPASPNVKVELLTEGGE